MTLEGKAWDDARAHALREYPRESCGLVVVVRGKLRYVSCTNAARTPSEHFVLPAAEWAAAEDLGDVMALVHSHPDTDARPSQADRVNCEATGVAWVVFAVHGLEAGPTVVETQVLRPDGYQAPLVGREFSYGTLDCYTLVRDWYRQERGVELPSFASEDGWWDRGETLVLDYYQRAGFRRVYGPPEPGDVVVMQIRASTPNHTAVYLGDGVMLHHMYNRLSTREPLGGYWLQNMVMLLRYSP